MRLDFDLAWLELRLGLWLLLMTRWMAGRDGGVKLLRAMGSMDLVREFSTGLLVGCCALVTSVIEPGLYVCGAGGASTCEVWALVEGLTC